MAKRRLSAILALDVVGYSRMMNDNAAGVLSALNELYKSVVTPAVAAGEGRVVKLLGDGALIEFSSAAQAIQCAVSIQQDLRKPETPYRCPDPLRLRAGLHAGDVVIEGDDIFGDGVNIAARLQAAAQPGGILASRIFCDLAGSDVPVRLVREGAHSFKGMANPIEVLSVDFSDPEEAERRASIARTQEVRFLKTKDNVSVAWVSNGEGAPVVKAPHWIGHLELDWRNPGLAAITASLADRYRLVRFDARGNGLSDWNAKDISFERYVDDMEQVFDAAGIERAPIVGVSQGAAYSIAFAARRPERVSALLIIGGFALGRAQRKLKKDRDLAKAFSSMMTAGWEDEFPSLRDLMAQIIIPGASEEERRLYAKDMRQMITPENIKRIRKVVDYLDITPLLPEIDVPCLVCHCTGDRMQPIEQGRALAAGLKNARFLAYDSSNHLVTETDPIWPLLERDMHGFLADHAA
ncbi:MAG: alpha/beta fold hydrolase [Rhizobiales bacterium]|nr:alpha/beta fold hydrolase [Hyphomicrobiales bacterium]